MKRGIFITLLAVALLQPCFSKENIVHQQNTVEALFNSFSKEKDITHVKIGGVIMKFANVFSDTKGVTGVEVYSFEECNEEVKGKLNRAIKTLKDNAYETLVSTTQNGENTKILVRIKENFIDEIVVIAGGNDPALVRIKGKIKPEDIQSVVDNNK